MCLTLDSSAVERVADRDIVCYKVVNKSIRSVYYRTFYRGNKIEIGKTYNSSLKKYTDVWKRSIVEKGLHSFFTKTDVFDLYKKTRKSSTPMFVVKCIIPKGSLYYAGTFGKSRSYASNRIIYKEIVYTWKTY